MRHYSDTLLIFRLKALRPDLYRERPVKLPLPPTPAATAASDAPDDSDTATGVLSLETIRQIQRDVYGLDV